ncbi:MAG: class II glutamine amidotransferase, partial [Clostridia bacterium]|nr:class II glutamine amidotransferase [Clostridia bacterium]
MMCGIYGVIGNKAYEKVLNGLKLLQYRGYDSCGIAYFNNGFKIEKAVGSLENLKLITQNETIAFGHTRWATNGEVNLENAHPHVSYDGNITIVHNGRIKNSNKLKNDLIKKGINFYSTTDTEVIANFIAYNCKIKNIEEVLNQLFEDLEGSYSLIIGCQNKDLYLVKKFSPLNVLVNEENIYISSDI